MGGGGGGGGWAMLICMFQSSYHSMLHVQAMILSFKWELLLTGVV